VVPENIHTCPKEGHRNSEWYGHLKEVNFEGEGIHKEFSFQWV